MIFLNLRGNEVARAEKYRRYAAECLRIARTTQDPREKATLLAMADKWRELADKAESDAKHKPPEEGD